MGSVVGPKSTADVRQFLAESTGLTVLGCGFERSPAGFLVLSCGYIDVRGHHRTKRLALGVKFPNAADEVVDLSVIMSEWMTHGEGHMLDLLDAGRTPEMVQ
jgi:hypothetical protein